MSSDNFVREVLNDLEIDLKDVEDDTRLRDDLGVDSTELVEIAVAIERHTTRKIDTNDILALRTFGELVEYVDNAPTAG